MSEIAPPGQLRRWASYMNMKKSILFAAILVLLLLVNRQTSAQCTCKAEYKNITARNEFNLAYAVFVGKVLRINRSPEDKDGRYTETVHFTVTKTWKRDLEAKLTITNRIQGCVNGFKENEEWFVYLYRHQDGTLGTYCCCSRTTPLSKASEDLKTFADDPPAKVLRPTAGSTTRWTGAAERVWHQTWCGDAFLKSRRLVNSDVRLLRCPIHSAQLRE